MDGRVYPGIYQMRATLLVLFSVYPLICRGSWKWLSISSAGVPEHLGCENLPFTSRQRDLCRRKPFLLPSIMDGARLGISECRAQFKHERWNCSTTKAHLSVFGYELNSGTKETAFILAVMAAGLVHAVTRSCSAGNVTDCSCEGGLRGRGSPGGGWHWGGCSDHAQYGSALSRRFVHRSVWNVSSPRSGHALLAMNQHNSEAGRQAVARTMSNDCRCHGISGSCAVKTCWRTMAPFGQVGVFLKARYEAGVQVRGVRSKRGVRRRERSQRYVPLGSHELVFLRRSPDYCLADRRLGVAGTRGRSCSRAGAGPGSCSLLCCGRGYDTRVVRHAQRCDCKFVWCCYVHCRRCESVSDEHTCK